jgi:alkylation response protein AidB-like acyl-CoA dehydrogenase
MSWSGLGLAEHEAELVALVDRLGAGQLGGLSDPEPAAVASARGAIADCGLWGLDVPEASGGAGAGYREAQLVHAALAHHSPAVALAAAHLTAAAVALAADDRGKEALHASLNGSAAVAVVDVERRRDELTAGSTVNIPRVDVCAREPLLLALFDDGHVGLVEPANAEFGPLIERTGLDGALTCPARFTVRAATEIDAAASPIRIRWYTAMAAVAAGLAKSAADLALQYAGERIQFNGPLTALPVVRGQLFDQRAGARSLLLATLTQLDGVDAAAGLLDRSLDAAMETAAAAQQTHGGYGYLEEFPVVRKFRDAVSLQAAANRPRVRDIAARALAATSPRPQSR